ncbi:MAG: hypothetical protein Q8O62_01835 [Aequorivita sp.]|nr:hypothetical protein [Aequorivita sp.]
MKEEITKAINILVCYSYLYPSTKFVYIQIYPAYLNVGFYDTDKKPFTLYEMGELEENSNGNQEAFTTKGLLEQYDELGVEELANFFQDKQFEAAVKNITDSKKKNNSE